METFLLRLLSRTLTSLQLQYFLGVNPYADEDSSTTSHVAVDTHKVMLSHWKTNLSPELSAYLYTPREYTSFVTAAFILRSGGIDQDLTEAL